MPNQKPEIPYGAYWSTPFCKWQGSFQDLHALTFAAWVADKELKKREISPGNIDHLVLGTTIPQKHSFYGAPWVGSLFGAETTGPSISQACATGTRCLAHAEQEISSNLAKTVLIVTADRTSNGPHIFYPNPAGIGGTGDKEDWVLDNFSYDPLGKHAMIQTAENVAAKHQITIDEQHDLVLKRFEQYQDSLKDDYAFQRKYMSIPFDVPHSSYKKILSSLSSDEGISKSTKEGLSELKPILKDGTVTYGSQTHPADGNSGLIVTTEENIFDLSKDTRLKIEILGFGQARTELAFMPEATIPAVQNALKHTGFKLEEMDAIKSHNPFAVNDLVFSKVTGTKIENMNNFGCSMIWGHPQGPTAIRGIIELIEELVGRGGGLGLFFGCAAGDTAMAAILRVTER